MAKRQNERDSKARIFRAAAAEFAEHGYEAAGVDRIAAKARVNKAMIYYHYRSKLGLYIEVVRDMFRAVGDRARAIADGPGTPDEKIATWVATIVDEASHRPWFPPIMLRELASGIPHFDAETLGLMSVVYLSVRDMIVEGQQDGSFRDVDPLLMHLSIMPAVLIFFVRERAIEKRPKLAAAPAAWAQAVAAPRSRDQFVEHMQQAVRGMLRRD
jgi:TetR/AcrR family transcriptional regulator